MAPLLNELAIEENTVKEHTDKNLDPKKFKPMKEIIKKLQQI